jgi:phage shock protein A
MLENSIGPLYAPFYDTYAAALGEKGKVEEAIKLVERALAQKAQPMKKLQLRLEALKQSQQVQQPTSSVSSTSAPSSKPTATSNWEDEPVRILSLPL